MRPFGKDCCPPIGCFRRQCPTRTYHERTHTSRDDLLPSEIRGGPCVHCLQTTRVQVYGKDAVNMLTGMLVAILSSSLLAASFSSRICLVDVLGVTSGFFAYAVTKRTVIAR
jgi:hypothetical protein